MKPHLLEDLPGRAVDERTRGPVLVTGATGFTGGHLAIALRRRGYAVRALARPGADVSRLCPHGVTVCRGDLCNASDVDRAVAGTTTVYHIAAVYRSARYPDSYYRAVNVDGTRYVLEAARRHGLARVVHCSTAGVHGEVQQVPADESAPLAPGDIYQQTKLEAEELARHAFANEQPGVIFRPVGIYGPGDLRFLKLFRTIQSGTFRMFGSGEVLYHLTYIDDLVDGIIRCGERQQALGETYLLAGPRYTSLNELVALVAAAVGAKPPRGHLPLKPLLAAAALCEFACRLIRIEPPLHRRRFDFFLKDRAFSCDKARRELGYEPRVDLAEGLARTAAWYFAKGHLKRKGTRAEVAARPAVAQETGRADDRAV